MKVAIQGQPASFHDVAARQFFGDDIDLVYCNTFADTFAALHEGRAHRAMVAIWNSNYGPIEASQSLLRAGQYRLLGQTDLPIHQCLVGFPGCKLEDITEVHSHPVALAQCQTFLVRQLPHAKQCEHADTAGAAKDIASWGNPHKAAIASEAAAAAYGLVVLAKNIETDQHNTTRFVAISKQG